MENSVTMPGKIYKINWQLGKCWQHFKVFSKNFPATYETIFEKIHVVLLKKLDKKF